MSHTVLTMSRGDSARLAEWVTYHARLGFDEFHILLDNPCDDSEQVLTSLQEQGFAIRVDVLEPLGDYHPEGISLSERWARVKKWRQEHAEEIAKSGLAATDALSWRQLQRLPVALEEYVRRKAGSGWLALIDVDEFIVLESTVSISQFLMDVEQPRVRLTSFNMNTAGWDGASSVLEHTRQRWSYEDMLEYGKGWPQRVKSIVRYEVAMPLLTVHGFNKGPYQRTELDAARLLHFKFPPMDMLPYPVEDRGALERWQAGAERT